MTQTSWRFPVAPIAALPGVSNWTLLLNRVSKIMAPGRRGRA